MSGVGIEAEALQRKATISKLNSKKWAVEYRWDRDDRFLGIDIVRAKSHVHSLLGRLPHLDLAYIRRGDVHDIRDGHLLIRAPSCPSMLRDPRQILYGELKRRVRRGDDDKR